MILLEYQNIKTFLQKAKFQIDLKELKTLCRSHMFRSHCAVAILLVILKAKKLLGRFTKKNDKTQIK